MGLAVGDIDTVRKQAAIRLLSQTVDWHNRIEAALPRRLYSLIVSSSWKSKSSLDSPSTVRYGFLFRNYLLLEYLNSLLHVFMHSSLLEILTLD